jgi:tRNA threonylcarbamoyladenosine biosynthesis protein TsaE
LFTLRRRPVPDLSLHLEDEDATLRFGRVLAATLVPGMYLALSGQLGTGKTTLTRGLLAGLGWTEPVRSPTYTLLEPYTFSKIDFYHFDLFRFREDVEWHESGFSDYFNPTSICVVEWPERAGQLAPQADLDIRLSVAGAGRDMHIDARTDTGRACLGRLSQVSPPPF